MSGQQLRDRPAARRPTAGRAGQSNGRQPVCRRADGMGQRRRRISEERARQENLRRGATVGASMADWTRATVLWPAEVTWPAELGDVYPKTLPPLRTDRDTVVVGAASGALEKPIEIRVAGRRRRQAGRSAMVGRAAEHGRRPRVPGASRRNGTRGWRHLAADGRLGRPGRNGPAAGSRSRWPDRFGRTRDRDGRRAGGASRVASDAGPRPGQRESANGCSDWRRSSGTAGPSKSPQTVGCRLPAPTAEASDLNLVRPTADVAAAAGEVCRTAGDRTPVDFPAPGFVDRPLRRRRRAARRNGAAAAGVRADAASRNREHGDRRAAHR